VETVSQRTTHNSPPPSPEGVMCRCTHTTQTHHSAMLCTTHAHATLQRTYSRRWPERTRYVDLRSLTLLAAAGRSGGAGGARAVFPGGSIAVVRLAHDGRGRGHGTSGSAVSHLVVGGICVGLSVAVGVCGWTEQKDREMRMREI
jgi:hypothetical protein